MSNANELNRFRRKRDEWLECLAGDDRNSVKRQVWRLLWNTATFRILNHARLLAATGTNGEPQLSGLMHEFMNDGFFAYQLVSIRRLSDSSPAGGRRGVFSLRRLLLDLEENAALFTRRNMMDAEGLNYDYSEVEARFLAFVSQKRAAGERAYSIPRELAYRVDENRHMDIDALSGTKPERRAETDSVRKEIFRVLLTRFDKACSEIELYTNKFLAHAATPESRAAENADSVKVTLAHIYDAHKVICEIANFVSISLLGESNVVGLATPQFDQFEYIDRPLVTDDQIDELRNVWEAFEKEAREWGNWSMAEMEIELAKRGEQPQRESEGANTSQVNGVAKSASGLNSPAEGMAGGLS